MSPLLSGVLFLLLIWLLKSCWVLGRYIWTLKKLPQPPTTKFFFGNVLDLISVPRAKLSMAFIKMVLPIRDNPIICIWIFHRPRVMITKAKVAEEVLSSNNLLEKASFYDVIHPWLGKGLLTSSGQEWRSHRKLLTPSFHFRILDNFMPIFNEQSALMVRKLSEECAGKGVFNVYPYITLCALDIISETAMGTKTNAQMGKNKEYVQAISSLSEILLTRNIKAWLLNPVLFELSGLARKQRRCLQVLHGFTTKVIEERRLQYESHKKSQRVEEEEGLVFGQKRRLAFLDTLLQASDNFTQLSMREIREEVDTFMFEGHDTTSVAIGWVLQHLGFLPSVQEKVHEELDMVFGDNITRDVTLEDLSELKYLGAVIKESLRLTPSVPLFGRKMVADTVLGGFKVPAGTDVLINVALIGLDEKIYKSPYKFDPSRFFNEEWLGRHPYSYVAFSAGPRNCIGQKFAMREEKVVLAHILRKFRVKSHVSFDLMEVVPDLVLRPIKGFRVELIERRK